MLSEIGVAVGSTITFLLLTDFSRSCVSSCVHLLAFDCELLNNQRMAMACITIVATIKMDTFLDRRKDFVVTLWENIFWPIEKF